MATAAISWTQKGAKSQFSGTAPFVWGTDTMKLMLLEADFDGAVAQFINHASINEIESGDGSYPAGGYALTTQTNTDAAGPIVKLLAENITDTGVTTEDAAIYCAIYKDTGTPSTSRIYAKGVITGTVQPSNGTLTITFTGGVVLQVGS